MKNVEIMNNNLVELTEDNFETEVLQTGIPVVVDFYAPWCGPCKIIAPLLGQFASEFEGRLKFAKANVVETPELAASFEITGVPTLMLFRGGQPVDQVVGFPGPRQFKAWLDNAVNAPVTA
jgi:thioredoxin 1